jgi:PAS domain S-box-containing protein
MQGPLRILLVDDNAEDRNRVIRELSREFSDLQVEQISDAGSFARALKAEHFDLVITDYQLQWSDGLKVLRALKRRYPHCPVIMLTANGNESIAVEGMKAGLEDYVLKSPQQLVCLGAIVQSLLLAAGQRETLRASHEVARACQEKWQALITAAPLALIAIDLEGRVTTWNPAAERLFAWSAMEVMGRPNPIVPADRLGEHRDILERALKGEVVSNLETQRQRKDGTRVEVSLWTAVFHDSHGRMNGVMGIFSDITERKREQKQLHHLTPRQREILQLMAGGKATKEIASMLRVSPKTVEFHRAQLMDRLKIHDVPGLVRYAVRNGLISLDV